MSVCADCGEKRSNRESDPHGQFGHHDFVAKKDEPEVKPRDMAAVAVVWALIADFAEEKKEQARNWVAEHLRSESMRGVDAVANGEVIGSVTRSKDREVRDVTDDSAFVEYVMRHHPNVLMVPWRWKTEFVKTLDAVDTDTGTVFVDGDGEVVPGVGVRTLQGQVKVNKTGDARELVRKVLTPAEERLQELLEVQPEPVDRYTQDREAGAL